jgi:replicative DNA helicase
MDSDDARRLHEAFTIWQAQLRRHAQELRDELEPFRLGIPMEDLVGLISMGDPSPDFVVAHAQAVSHIASHLEEIATDLDLPKNDLERYLD